MKRPALLLVLAMLFLGAPPAAAQIPERFENLEVLPDDISRDSLMQVMRGISQSLGVRCVYCHVGQEGVANFAGYDFDSDEKRTKRTARFMMRMVRDLNSRVLAELPDRTDPPVRVTCITCHHGLPLPMTIEQVLNRTIDSAGVPAAIARYRELRGQMLDRGRYDFGEGPVSEVARGQATAGRTAEAVALLQMNAELHPTSPAIDVQLGDVYRMRGERDLAVARYRAALEKDPNNRMARRGLDELAPAQR